MEKYRITKERSDRVARTFQEAMQRKGFRTQKDLAQACGVAPATVSYTLKSIGENTSFIIVAKLASVLDIDLDEIAAALDLKFK